MVGRLHFAGRCHRTRTRVPHFGPCVRDDSAASAKGSRRNTSANERRKSPPILHPESRSLCGAILCATGFPHIETFHSEALSVNFESSHFACIWRDTAVRHFNCRSAAFLPSTIQQWIRLGYLQSPAQSCVDELRLCDEG